MRRRELAHWYGIAPGAWSYGLPEVSPPEGRLIANPGCYATAALLALGAARGRARRRGRRREVRDDRRRPRLKERSHAGSVLENFSPYAVGEHRHAPEIGQALGFPVTFVPHLLPVRRGLLATCYVRFGRGRCARARGGVRGSEVVRVLPEGVDAGDRARSRHGRRGGRALHRPRDRARRS